jgi:Methyltransferase domain/C-methyltransferase C-terminal domain
MERDQNASHTCPVCQSRAVDVFFEAGRVPVLCNRLWSTRAEALRAPVSDIRLGLCARCHHIFNVAFDPTAVRYTSEYENALHFSPRFREYADGLARQLVERYALRAKTIVEIGSGDGYFLQLLCDLGGNRGFGFDPYCTVTENAEPRTTSAITLIPDTFSERYAVCRPDLVCCRHVLEHLADPAGFLVDLRKLLDATPNTVVFFEVPDAAFMLRRPAIWDVIYEHHSYFSAASLSYAFAAAGFEVRELCAAFGEQVLCVDAIAAQRPGAPAPTDDVIVAAAASFAARAAEKATEDQRMVERLGKDGRRALVWGAGSKGIAFLNRLGIGSPIGYVVDVNPRKHGLFIPVTGQEVVPPAFVRTCAPDVVLLMNAIYEPEVRTELERLGVRADLVAV